MPTHVSYINGKYSSTGPGNWRSKATERRQRQLQQARKHGWTPDLTEALALIDGLSEDCKHDKGRVEPTHIRKGKTRGKFKFPKNWKVDHAIKM